MSFSSTSLDGYSQLWASIFFFLFGSYLMAMAGDITDDIYFRYYCDGSSKFPTPLPDLLSIPSMAVIDFLREKKIEMVSITDPLIGILSLILLISLFARSKLRGKRALIFSHLCIVWGMCTYFRALCLTTTVLPSFHNDICPALMESRKKNGHLNIFISGFMHLSAPFTQYYPMADYMFSGHAAGATAVYLVTVFEIFSKGNSPWERVRNVLFTLYYLIAVLSIVLTRLHYTADVLIGIFIAVFSYILYLLMVEKCRAKQLIFPYNLVNWIEKQDLHLE